MKNYYDKILKFIQLNHEKAKDILTKKEKISLKDIVKDHIDNEREFSIEEREMLTNIIGFGKSRVEGTWVRGQSDKTSWLGYTVKADTTIDSIMGSIYYDFREDKQWSPFIGASLDFVFILLIAS